MEVKNAQGKTTIKEAFQKGVEIGKDYNVSKADLKRLIAKRIKECRIESNLTQEQISKKINANYLTYRGYENCKSDIPVFYLIRLADLFDVTVDYLTGRTEEKKPSFDKKASEETEERLKQLEEAVEKLSKKIQET